MTCAEEARLSTAYCFQEKTSASTLGSVDTDFFPLSACFFMHPIYVVRSSIWRYVCQYQARPLIACSERDLLCFEQLSSAKGAHTESVEHQ